MTISARLSNTLLALFCGVVVIGLLYLYYGQAAKSHADLRNRIENKLFDLRSRLAPDLTSTDRVGIVAITAKTIRHFRDDTALDPDAAKDPDLSVTSLATLIDAVLAADPAKVVVLLPPQIFNYLDPKLSRIADIKDSRLALGTFGLERFTSDSDRIPKPLRASRNRIYSASDLSRDFRRNVVRDVTVRKESGQQMLAWHIANLFGATEELLEDAEEIDGRSMIRLNYLDIKRFRIWDGADIMAGDVDNLRGRTIFIGYTDYRPWTFRYREATHINTPWQTDGDDVAGGRPVVYLQALTANNIIERSWLHHATVASNVVQTLVIAIFSLLVWRFSVGFASFLIIGFWCLVLIVHAFLFAIANTYIPLADAILFSTIAAIGGALWKLRLEGRQRALQEARASAEHDLAKTQERFLDRFATELAKINENVHSCLIHQEQLAAGEGTMAQAYTKALGGCEELRDYLTGIEQFAKVTGEQFRQTHFEPVDIKSEIDKILGQFDSRKSAKQVHIHVEGDDARCRTDRTLVTQIIFNLISNAIKYSPDTGNIWITIKQHDEQLTIAVKDQGPGISETNQEKIFEKFYRVKDDQVYKLKGHGLGLYLSRYFADRIQAKISVSSKEGEGATFLLVLPNKRRSR